MTDSWNQEVVQEQVLLGGQVRLTRERGGRAVMAIGESGTYVWSWTTNSTKEPWLSPAEELARALALVDTRFEVRRHT